MATRGTPDGSAEGSQVNDAETEYIAPNEEGGSDSGNILESRRVGRLLLSRWFPLALQLPMILVFFGLIAVATLGEQDSAFNLGSVLIWVFWWPFLFLTIFLFGRVWCGTLCPAGALSSLAHKWLGRRWRVPKPVRAAAVMTIFFVLLTFWQRVVELPHSQPALTGYFFLFIIVMATGSGLLFGGKAWCRYLCPIGMLLGVYSRLSPLELRTNARICHGCKSLECIKGTDSVSGCPMFISPRGLDTNRNCIFCMQCAKACPRGAVQLRWRRPGAELAKPNSPTLAESAMVVLVAGMLFVETYSMVATFGGLRATLAWAGEWGSYFILFFGALLFFGVVFAVAATLTGLIARVFQAQGDFRGLFKTVGYAVLPLVMFAHFGHNLIHLQMDGGILLQVLGLTSTSTTAHVHIGATNGFVAGLNLFLLGVGLFWSLWLASRILRLKQLGAVRAMVLASPLVLAMLGLSFAYLTLLGSPMGSTVQGKTKLESSGASLLSVLEKSFLPDPGASAIAGPTWSYDFANDQVGKLSLSANGDFIAIGARDNLYFFDKNGELKWQYPTGNWVLSTSMSNDGSYVAAGTYDKILYLDKFGRLIWKRDMPMDTHVSMSASGAFIAAGSSDTVYYFDRPGDLLWDYKILPEASDVYVFGASMSADGNHILVAESYGTNIYHLDSTGALEWKAKIGSHSHGVSISSTGNYFPIGSGQSMTAGKVSFFDRNGTLRWSSPAAKDVDSIAMSADEADVVAGSMDNNVYYFDREGTLKWKYLAAGGAYVSISGDGSKVTAAGGNSVYSLDREGRLQWAYRTGPWVWGESVLAVATSADGGASVAITPHKLLFFDNARVQPTSPVYGTLLTFGLVFLASLGLVGLFSRRARASA